MTIVPSELKAAPACADLTPLRVFRILLFSTAIWLGVAAYIRTAGPLGAFAPSRILMLFATTFLATIPVNWIALKISGLPPERMVSVVAVAAIVPPILEGILMSRLPQFYGADPVVIGQAAVWLLYAIGVAMLLGTVTSLRAVRRLRAGDHAPVIQATSLKGVSIAVPDHAAALTHVQFLRFAGCPVCNLHLQQFIRRKAELGAAGIREVVLFHSAASFIDDYHGDLPFDLIADPHREIYARYHVEQSPWAILSPMAWPALVKGYRLRQAGKIDSTAFGLPADFLIDAGGRIIDCHYGSVANDQWSVDDVLKHARRGQPAEASIPGRTVGTVA